MEAPVMYLRIVLLLEPTGIKRKTNEKPDLY